jgi:serine/threonine protein kinase
MAQRIPAGLSERDSITLAENYITKWIQNEILIQKAKENLKSDEQDFTRQLEEYRNSLLLFTLEQKLVSQYLDTVVTPQEIESYFIENRSQFELKGNIVKFDFIKINKRSRFLREFRNLLKSDKPENVIKLANYAEKNATDYWFAMEWVSFNDLLEVMPLEVDNQALFLRRTNYAEAEDSLFVYLVRINDYKTADSTSPVEFEKDKIRNIILNARKIDLINKKRQEYIDQAFKEDKAKIY